jgi:hypothetical protein
MLPLYTTRIVDLGQGDFVKVDWPPAFNVALLTPEALLRQRFSPAVKVLEMKDRLLIFLVSRARAREKKKSQRAGSPCQRSRGWIWRACSD